MSQSSSRSNWKFWIVLYVILLFVYGVFGHVHVAIVRNYWQLRFLHSLQRDGTPARITRQVSRVADAMRDDGGMNRLAGMCFLIAGDHERALEYLLRVQKIRTDDHVTSYWLGKTYDYSGDYANALLAMYQAGNHEYFPAIPMGKELETTAQDLIGRPISAHARFELAKQVYSIDGDLARQYFELAFRTAPEVLHYSLDAAWFLYSQGDFEAARIFGERARSLFPEEAWVWVFWGTWNRAKGSLDQAIQDLEKAIERSPTGSAGSAAHVELSKICILRREYDAAVEHLESADKIQEGQLSIYLLRSQAYAGLQECTAAREQLMAASSLVQTNLHQDIYFHFEKIVQKNCP